MNRTFRKYHRMLAIPIFLPLFLTVLTGLGYTIFDEWFGQDDIAHTLLEIHTMKIVHLDKIYPVLNGIGVIGLAISGLTMTGLFKRKKAAS